MNKRKLKKQIKLGNTNFKDSFITIKSQLNRFKHSNFNPQVITPIWKNNKPRTPTFKKGVWL